MKPRAAQSAGLHGRNGALRPLRLAPHRRAFLDRATHTRRDPRRRRHDCARGLLHAGTAIAEQHVRPGPNRYRRRREAVTISTTLIGLRSCAIGHRQPRAPGLGDARGNTNAGLAVRLRVRPQFRHQRVSPPGRPARPRARRRRRPAISREQERASPEIGLAARPGLRSYEGRRGRHTTAGASLVFASTRALDESPSATACRGRLWDRDNRAGSRRRSKRRVLAVAGVAAPGQSSDATTLLAVAAFTHMQPR